MSHTLAAATLVVRDYDEAIAFFTQALRFRLLEDTPLSPDKRWVMVAPDSGGTGLLLARAATPAQQAAIGRQAGGRVAFFLHTRCFDDDLAHFAAHGVRLTETPRHEAYGRVVVFLDLYGNRWDLVERASQDRHPDEVLRGQGPSLHQQPAVRHEHPAGAADRREEEIGRGAGRL